MRVHHLDCASMAPLGGRLLAGAGGLFQTAPLVTHCLLLEVGADLVLVDAGLGLADVVAPGRRLGAAFLALARPALRVAETAARQIAARGLDPGAVRHVIVTHLDLDHAGGLADFPTARVHVTAAELAAATAPPTRRERHRYRAVHFAHGPAWVPAAPGGADFLGCSGVRELPGLPPEILLVPLPGHTRGHAGVAVATAGGWLLHAGDAYYHRAELAPGGAPPPLFALLERLETIDPVAGRASRAALRRARRAHADTLTICCSHDPAELAAATAPRPGPG